MSEEELAGLRGRKADLAEQLAAARREVELLEEELRGVLARWSDLDQGLTLAGEAERLREQNERLRDSLSFRLGRTLLAVPRAVYLRLRAPHPGE